MLPIEVLLNVERGVFSTEVVAEQVLITKEAANGVDISPLRHGSTSSCSTSCGVAEASDVSSSHSGDGGVGGGGALEVLSTHGAAGVVTVLFFFFFGGFASTESEACFS